MKVNLSSVVLGVVVGYAISSTINSFHQHTQDPTHEPVRRGAAPHHFYLPDPWAAAPPDVAFESARGAAALPPPGMVAAAGRSAAAAGLRAPPCASGGQGCRAAVASEAPPSIADEAWLARRGGGTDGGAPPALPLAEIPQAWRDALERSLRETGEQSGVVPITAPNATGAERPRGDGAAAAAACVAALDLPFEAQLSGLLDAVAAAGADEVERRRFLTG